MDFIVLPTLYRIVGELLVHLYFHWLNSFRSIPLSMYAKQTLKCKNTDDGCAIWFSYYGGIISPRHSPFQESILENFNQSAEPTVVLDGHGSYALVRRYAHIKSMENYLRPGCWPEESHELLTTPENHQQSWTWLVIWSHQWVSWWFSWWLLSSTSRLDGNWTSPVKVDFI